MAELPMPSGAVKQTGRRPPARPEVVSPVDCDSAQGRTEAKISGRAAKIHFIDLVVRSRQADPFIGLFGPGIAGLHVKPQPAYDRALGRQPPDVRVERLKDALPAPAPRHIDALDPPEETVAPVAPFRRDEQLADNLRAYLGNPVGSSGWVGQY